MSGKVLPGKLIGNKNQPKGRPRRELRKQWLNLESLASWAQHAASLLELQRVHVDQDGGLGDFLFVAIG
jgi:hypothetical protein